MFFRMSSGNVNTHVVAYKRPSYWFFEEHPHAHDNYFIRGPIRKFDMKLDNQHNCIGESNIDL